MITKHLSQWLDRLKSVIDWCMKYINQLAALTGYLVLYFNLILACLLLSLYQTLNSLIFSYFLPILLVAAILVTTVIGIKYFIYKRHERKYKTIDLKQRSSTYRLIRAFQFPILMLFVFSVLSACYFGSSSYVFDEARLVRAAYDRAGSELNQLREAIKEKSPYLYELVTRDRELAESLQSGENALAETKSRQEILENELTALPASARESKEYREKEQQLAELKEQEQELLHKTGADKEEREMLRQKMAGLDPALKKQGEQASNLNTTRTALNQKIQELDNKYKTILETYEWAKAATKNLETEIEQKKEANKALDSQINEKKDELAAAERDLHKYIGDDKEVKKQLEEKVAQSQQKINALSQRKAELEKALEELKNRRKTTADTRDKSITALNESPTSKEKFWNSWEHYTIKTNAAEDKLHIDNSPTSLPGSTLSYKPGMPTISPLHPGMTSPLFSPEATIIQPADTMFSSLFTITITRIICNSQYTPIQENGNTVNYGTKVNTPRDIQFLLVYGTTNLQLYGHTGKVVITTSRGNPVVKTTNIRSITDRLTGNFNFYFQVQLTAAEQQALDEQASIAVSLVAARGFTIPLSVKLEGEAESGIVKDNAYIFPLKDLILSH